MAISSSIPKEKEAFIYRSMARVALKKLIC